MKNQINFQEVKRILDQATWNYEYCSSLPGSNVETACSYLDTQKFSVKKIKEFTPDLKDTDIQEDWDQEEINEYIARFVADQLAWDRISKFLYVQYKRPNGWAIDESVSFKAE